MCWQLLNGRHGNDGIALTRYKKTGLAEFQSG